VEGLDGPVPGIWADVFPDWFAEFAVAIAAGRFAEATSIFAVDAGSWAVGKGVALCGEVTACGDVSPNESVGSTARVEAGEGLLVRAFVFFVDVAVGLTADVCGSTCTETRAVMLLAGGAVSCDAQIAPKLPESFAMESGLANEPEAGFEERLDKSGISMAAITVTANAKLIPMDASRVPTRRGAICGEPERKIPEFRGFPRAPMETVRQLRRVHSRARSAQPGRF